MRIGRYVLLEPLGEGGMGRVYRAELQGRDGFRKIVALKVLHDVVGHARYTVEAALLHEARIGAMLSHPNVVDVQDYGVDDGRPWVALEYVDGVTLDSVLRSARRFPATVALDIGIQLCSALAHVHTLHDGTAPLVHRDLKPSNILLSRHGLVKLTDFGIAKTDLVSGCTTASGIMKGTPSFIAPEQILGQRVDGRADLFATGAVLYELATGRRLFRRHRSDAMIAAVLAVDSVMAAPEVLAEVDDNIPGLGEIVQRCLQRDPNRRFDTATALAAALEVLRHELPPGPNLRMYRDHLKVGVESSEYPELPGAALGNPVAETAADAILRLARQTRRVITSPRRTQRRPRGSAVLLAITHVALFLTALTWGGPTSSVAEPLQQQSPLPMVAPAVQDMVVVLEPPPAVEPVAIRPRSRASAKAEPVPEPDHQDALGTVRHPQPVGKAAVGQRKSFIVQVSGDPAEVAVVFNRPGEGPERRALSRFRDGFWGVVVPFFASMEGESSYRFEGPGLEPTQSYALTVTSSDDRSTD
jgi:serine/threonine protein kinase